MPLMAIGHAGPHRLCIHVVLIQHETHVNLFSRSNGMSRHGLTRHFDHAAPNLPSVVMMLQIVVTRSIYNL